MYKVMIVDDEPLMLEGMRLMIHWEDYGFTLTAQASSAAEALRLLEKEAVDLLFTDISMPDMNGVELSEHCRRLYPQVLIAYFSGYQNFSYAQAALRVNAISTDSLISSQAYRYYSTPGDYYDSYIRLLLPQVRRYQNAYSRQVNNIELYVDNPTALSGGVCMRIEQFETIPWIPEGYDGETVFIPYIKLQPGSADRLQISLVRALDSTQPSNGVLTIDLSMEPLHRVMEQESEYLDLYLIAPDGYQISSSTAMKTPAEQVRSSEIPENAELSYELGGSTAFSGWTLYGVINQLPIERSLRSSLMLCDCIGLICLALGGLLSWLFGHSMSRRSRELLRHMDNTMPGLTLNRFPSQWAAMRSASWLSTSTP